MRPLRFAPLLGASILVSSACATVSDRTYQTLTAGLVGCPAEEIVLAGQQNVITLGEGAPTWRATCRGHTFICSAVGHTAKCTEELAPAATQPAAATASTSEAVAK